MRNYNDPQYKLWRKNIKKRDKNICQWPACNSKNKIHVHHIMKWSDYPGLRYHPHNGISLCKTHHDFIKDNEENYMHFFLKLIADKYNNNK